MRYLYSDLSFRFDGTPTNNLELAFGTDVNTNGVLEAEEVGARFGWRAGRHFIENTSTGDMFDGEAANPSQRFSVCLHLDDQVQFPAVAESCGVWCQCGGVRRIGDKCPACVDMTAGMESDAGDPSRHGASIGLD